MNQNTFLKGAFFAFCLVGMLALPAAAAPADGQMIRANQSVIDQGLKDELRANHLQYRLQEFDLNAQRAGSVITILAKYGVDTSALTTTLSSINSKRSALETTLSSGDQTAVKAVNTEIRDLWKEFRSGIKAAIKVKYGIPAISAGSKHSQTSSADIDTGSLGIGAL